MAGAWLLARVGSRRAGPLSFRHLIATALAVMPLLVATFILGAWVPALLGYGSGIFVAMVAVSTRRANGS